MDLRVRHRYAMLVAALTDIGACEGLLLPLEFDGVIVHEPLVEGLVTGEVGVLHDQHVLGREKLDGEEAAAEELLLEHLEGIAPGEIHSVEVVLENAGVQIEAEVLVAAAPAYELVVHVILNRRRPTFRICRSLETNGSADYIFFTRKL